METRFQEQYNLQAHSQRTCVPRVVSVGTTFQPAVVAVIVSELSISSQQSEHTESSKSEGAVRGPTRTELNPHATVSPLACQAE